MKFASGIVVGVELGAIARRWWRDRVRSGARGSLGIGLTHGIDQVEVALTQATGVSLLPGNRVTWRDNGQVFGAIEAAIRNARHSVHFDIYIWKPGQPGTALAELVADRAREGIAVRILVDPVGSTDFDRELCRPLREAGCEVRYFRPPRRHPFSFAGRNHRKLVVVDGRVGFTGGFGIAPEWSGDGLSPGAWRDANLVPLCRRGRGSDHRRLGYGERCLMPSPRGHARHG